MRDIIVVNFERTLQMLKRVIDDCPDNVWDVPDETVSIWQYAYHCLIGLDVWPRELGDSFVPASAATSSKGRVQS